MRPIKNFEDYIEEGLIIKRNPNISRARNLKVEAEKNYEFLKQIINSFNISDDNANNIIKLVYDIVMESIRSQMISKGFFSNNSHEAEVAYMRNLKFNDKDIQFCDQLRYFRNGILYRGKSFDKSYAKKTVDFLDKFRKHLDS